MNVKVLTVPTRRLKQCHIPEIVEAQTRKKCVVARGLWVFDIKKGTDADIATLARVGIIVEKC